ncbi:MAG: HAD hydrolase-like protein [Clostridia bacterium]|nr:HAD hydrolase-like protein [Clostridia bacterium]
MYRYLLFDLDGTLTDPAEGITSCVSYALAHFGIHADPKALTAFIGPPLREQFMEYAGFDSDTAEQAVAKYRERYSTTGIFENRVLDGIPSLLARLRDDGYILCVSSSKPEVFVVRTLEKFGLADLFTVTVGSELDGTRVKKAEVIEETLRRLACRFPAEDFTDRSACLMIGDRIYDIDGAAACGMDAVGVSFGYAAPGELESSCARAVIHTPNALLAFLKA